MADKAISELNTATQITSTDLFVLEQGGTAKKLTGQVLMNWLTAAADGHGGIQSIAKTSTSGLVDTYTITLADQTKTTFKVTNGAKGDKGDNAYVHIKYAAQQPTDQRPSIGDTPDNWIGFYSGYASAAPTNWSAYTWFRIKGEQGDTGAPAAILSQSVGYQVGESGTIAPSGNWSSNVPTVAQGKFLWTRTALSFNSGEPLVFYGVSHAGRDGSGSVVSVNDVSPDTNGNITLPVVTMVNELTPDDAGNVSLAIQQLATNGVVPTGNAPSDVEKFIFLANHPVGSIFESNQPTSPAELYGGTWARDTSGRVIISANDAHPVDSTGGEETHTLTIAELPKHKFRLSAETGNQLSTNYASNKLAVKFPMAYAEHAVANSTDTKTYYAWSSTTESLGEDAPHNIMQPYVAKYRWMRTA